MVLIAPVTAPEDGLIYSNQNVKLKIGHKIIDTGMLYISQNSLSWQPAHNADGISISWKQVSLHGISTNPSKCIYFMLDHKIHWRGVYEGGAGAAVANGNGIGAAAAAAAALGAGGGGGGGDGDMADEAQNDCDVDEGNATDEEDGDDADDVPEEEQMTECWLLPDDVNTVDTIFQAMTECQALHPDSADSISDESDFMDDDDEDNNEERYGPNVPAMGGGGGDGAGGGGGGDDADGAQGGMRNLNLNDERFADADE